MKPGVFPPTVDAETISPLLHDIEACAQKHAERMRPLLSDIADAGVRYGQALASYDPDGSRQYSAGEMERLQASLQAAHAALGDLCSLARRCRNDHDPQQHGGSGMLGYIK
ncbi:hypothetical protein L1889_00545 [Paenalcaligenes niemegkensis]|uniref:hypothetical protein n=1 Tax=Paenalcaligenes niemegkensis TaxID=2895469 RepID=UPI001EE9635A|nr:hypothetical protein [Paenalcaligenes niemegkensis]MCQ9615394.1 hypothetical protein [Paenalcaligenes niemegkensis]